MPLMRGPGNQVVESCAELIIFYIPKVLQSFDVTINRELDLGSDHRYTSASIEYIRSTEAWKTRKRSFKGWKPIRDEASRSHEYHSQ